MRSNTTFYRGSACCNQSRARTVPHALALRSAASALFTGSVDPQRSWYRKPLSNFRSPSRRQLLCRSAGMEPELNQLGLDFLKFLAAFVVITPVFKKINVSPILGFLLAGVLLRQADAISSPKELGDLAELGVLFLLFEMGLELSTDRLRALSTYAFGLGTTQVLATTAVFVAFSYPFGNSVGTWLLQHLAYADSQLASITSWEEAIVIAVALSLSSSAFVLQLLGDKGQLASRSGSATLGVLLLQDLVTVPFLVLVPLLAPGAPPEVLPNVAVDLAASAAEVARTAAPLTALGIPSSPETSAYLAAAVAAESLPTQAATLAQQFLPTVARSLGLLGGIILLGRVALRRIFGAVAATGSSDAFVAACLLTVCGTAIATDAAGFGQTLGAFLAGVLLAESSFRPQVEAEIKPFKGVLLGLFFLCTGASVDVPVLLSRFPTIALLTVGLLGVKFSITAISARMFGLSEGESVKVGLTLSQGGEFAFVLLALAQELKLLPRELNALLICVVVASMALTPLLADIGAWFEEREQKALIAQEASSLVYELMDPAAPQSVMAQQAEGGSVATAVSPVVILGFNEASQVVVNMLSSPLTGNPAPWIAFSFNPDAVRDARSRGLPVMFGDGSNINVMNAATDAQPRAFVLTLRSHGQLMDALRNVKKSWPDIPTFALCIDVDRASEALKLGATSAVVTRASAGVALGDALLRNLMDTSCVDLVFLEQEMQLMVKDAVLADVARDQGTSKSTNTPVATTPAGGKLSGTSVVTPEILSQQFVLDDEEDEVAQAVPQTSFIGTIRANPVSAEWPAPKSLSRGSATSTTNSIIAEIEAENELELPTSENATEESTLANSTSNSSSSVDPVVGGLEGGEDSSIGGVGGGESEPAAPPVQPGGSGVSMMPRGGAGAARIQIPPGGVALGKQARNEVRVTSTVDESGSSSDESDGGGQEDGRGDREEQYARTAAKLKMLEAEAAKQKQKQPPTVQNQKQKQPPTVQDPLKHPPKNAAPATSSPTTTPDTAKAATSIPTSSSSNYPVPINNGSASYDSVDQE